MDFDNAWCPACDKLIQPKRFTISVPVPQPQLQLKPVKQKQGLVNGTGRLKHIKQQQQQQPPVQMKKRTVIDQGPIPLYCSDECQLADLSATRSGPPLDPARDDPAPTNRSNYSTEGGDPIPSSIAKLAKLYNFPPIPPPPPTFDEEEEEPNMRITDYHSGIMMAGRLISSLCPPPAKPHVGRHRPPPVPREPVPGWTDGSNAWRASVYSLSSPPQSPAYADEVNKGHGSFTAPSHRAPRASSSSAIHSLPVPPPSQRSSSDQMIAKFSQSFQRRSHPSPPGEALPRSPPKRERAILPPAIEGQLLVPNVKLKVHSSSSTSLSATWSGPTSGCSARSPLSSDGEEQRFKAATSLPKRPVVETRSWSYDNFRTYPVMPLPPKKVLQKQIVDGKECEVEVEVIEERKCLFKFPPSLVSQ